MKRISLDFPPSGGLRGSEAWLLGFVLLMLTAANLSIAVSQASLGAALLVLLYRRLACGLPLPRTGLEWPSLLLAAWALLVIPFSTDPGQSLVFYKRFFLFAAVWTTAAAAADDRPLAWLSAALVTGAAGISIYGQVHVWRKTGALFGVRLGEMSNPMTSGCLLMLVLLVVAGLVLGGSLSRRTRGLLSAASLPVGIGLVQTMTRSAWLGLAAGLALILLLASRRLLVVFLLAVAAAAVLVPPLAERNAQGRLGGRITPDFVKEGENTSQRLEMWKAGWALVKERPLTGVGDRDLLGVMPRYYGDENTVYFGHLHSNPLMLAAIWGVPGFFLAMGLFVATLVQPWRRWRRLSAAGRTTPSWRRGWCLGAVGASCGFFVAGLTEWYFGDAESMLLFLAILGAALGSQRQTEETENA